MDPTVTNMYTETMVMTVSTAARRGGAGVVGLLIDRQRHVPAPVDEQGQGDACHEGPQRVDGEGIEPFELQGRRIDSGAIEVAVNRHRAEAEEHRQLKPHQQYWSFWVVCMSRYAIQVASVMKTRQVRVLTHTLSERSAMAGLRVTCASNR